MYHIPVLLNESIDGLDIRPGGIYVDVTFGGGGHSREILRRLNGTGRLFSFDQDADAEQNIGEAPENFTFVRSNFRYLNNWMRYYGVCLPTLEYRHITLTMRHEVSPSALTPLSI